jgi:hypothetical protein
MPRGVNDPEPMAQSPFARWAPSTPISDRASHLAGESVEALPAAVDRVVAPTRTLPRRSPAPTRTHASELPPA